MTLNDMKVRAFELHRQKMVLEAKLKDIHQELAGLHSRITLLEKTRKSEVKEDG